MPDAPSAAGSEAARLRAHPDFASTPPPERAHVAGLDLEPLTAAITHEDFDVVVASAGSLRGLFGDDWPDRLTLEENRVDLAWHQREFAARRSFAWVLREDGLYAGCLYVFPRLGERGRADVWFWFRSDEPDLRDRAVAFRAGLYAWFAGPDWPEIEMVFHS